MTAEVAILNRYGVALAADSATTITPKMKTYNSANKLFSLSKYEPVGIMIYGGAEIMGIPWETLIKEYRRQLGRRSFPELREYAEHFLEYVKTSPALSTEIQDEKFRELAIYLYSDIVDSLNSKVEELIDKESEIAKSKVGTIVAQTIDDYDKRLSESDLLNGFSMTDATTLTKNHSKVITEIINQVFDQLPISSSSRRKLRKLPGKLVVTRNNIEDEWGSISGLVIAGFGDNEMFPSLIEYQTRDVILEKLRYTTEREAKVDTRQRGMIIPFAQSDMVFAFMEGIDPYYLFVIKSYVRKLFQSYTKVVIENLTELLKDPDDESPFDKNELNSLKSETDKLLQRFMADIDRYRSEEHSTPILTALSFLGKSELAEMAESLVNLASFKKRMTLEAETVGGPVDVVVISKGDGLIWIKRKHYFDPKLNHSYFANYFGSAFLETGENNDEHFNHE